MQEWIDIIVARVLASFQGMILMWSGAIVDIPDGWALCDGSQGTPDLRNRFIFGAGGGSDPGDTGGSSQHNHTFVDGPHQHQLDDGTDIAAGDDFSDESDFVNVQGTTSTKNHLPPYYALAYIMRL